MQPLANIMTVDPLKAMRGAGHFASEKNNA